MTFPEEYLSTRVKKKKITRPIPTSDNDVESRGELLNMLSGCSKLKPEIVEEWCPVR